ncbi:mucosa-associated lymphoid tissue lymphoma translocation protein 1 [Chanos chanos]|uniref:Mucosa-associated lymphoid tissue lymphoma translocation protein 1 n=1 Tax=Chanos chanos TaxID=29144 RepID=A0A6J2URY3_CHACN|nr:mucosa-associated lymphoid tissue lymphoma translocation protein 1-like [Chanos chanos]
MLVQSIGVSRAVANSMLSEVVIVQQPVSVCVPPNYAALLSVQATGPGPLKYQWFNGAQEEVADGTRPELTVRTQNSQTFICRVSDQYQNWVFSKWVKVKVISAAGQGVCGTWSGEPHIVVHPVSQTVRQGDRLVLRCSAFGMPAPQYQWYRNGQILQQETSDSVEIKNVNADNAGSYLCAVSNKLEERWSEAADIEIVPPAQSLAAPLMASDKVALLIGNLNYAQHPGLMAPTMDVHQLSNLLQQLGFRVVSLLDLTLDEMHAAIDKFLQLLDRGVYAVFYYAGHGYEHAGRNYLVAVDAPRPYCKENCVCVQRVMRKMQERQATLNVILLDTCRKWYHQNSPPSVITPVAPLGNTVYGYATSEDAEAFEVQDGGKSTGIFTKYLNTHILEPKKVTHVLEQVSEDLGKDLMVCGRQVVEIKHTLKEPRSLADPVRTVGHTQELRIRDACWKQANVLPGRKLVEFSCGAQVELSFSALFSNVMVVFGKVKSMGPVAVDCTVCLRSTPVLEDIFSRADISDEMDSLLLNKSANPDCSLRLCCLQKLNKSLVIKVDLHYTHKDTRLRVVESKELDIGKPLVASCKFGQRKKQVDGIRWPRHQTADQISHYKQQPFQQPHGQPCRPSTRKADNVWESVPKAASVSSNEPEENDENESLDFTL